MRKSKLLTLLKMLKGELVLIFAVGVGSVILIVTPDEHKQVVLLVLRTVIQLLVKDVNDVSVE